MTAKKKYRSGEKYRARLGMLLALWDALRSGGWRRAANPAFLSV